MYPIRIPLRTDYADYVEAKIGKVSAHLMGMCVTIGFAGFFVYLRSLETTWEHWLLGVFVFFGVIDIVVFAAVSLRWWFVVRPVGMRELHLSPEAIVLRNGMPETDFGWDAFKECEETENTFSVRIAHERPVVVSKIDLMRRESYTHFKNLLRAQKVVIHAKHEEEGLWG